MVCAIESKFSVFSFQSAEFLPQGESSNAFFRQIHVGVSLNYANTTLPALYAGAKPGSLMLTRPPVVFVHGINSGPNVWEGPGNMASTLQNQGYIIEPTSFADHSMSDGGMGPLTTDWTYVQSAVEHTLQAFRAGGVKYSTDGPGNAVSTNLALGTLIAVQKVDVVAHSYGGLLTRWYMEQAADPLLPNSAIGSAFQDNRDIRTLIELGTPNLGSPMANMVDEIYNNPLIANSGLDANFVVNLAQAFGVVPRTMSAFLALLQLKGVLPTSGPGNGNGFPFFYDDAVNSPLLQQLNAPAAGTPFNASVGYAAVVGTGADYPIAPGLSLDLYGIVQPMGPSGQSYFPWINTFDGAANDSVVPTWSAALPDNAYDLYVHAPHTQLESNSTTEADVLALLANPNLPLGSAQAAAAGSNGWNPPVNDQNAYSGGTNSGKSTEVSGAGLNQDAIVGVQLNGTNYNATTWDMSIISGPTAGAGIKKPMLTGMALKSQLEAGITVSLVASSGAYYQPINTLDTATVTYGDAGLSVNANVWAAAGANDYVPFEINALEMGRGITQGVTGPTLGAVQDDSATGFALVGYTLGNLSSPTTQVNLPAYTPATPVVVSDNPTGQIQLQLNGAFQVTDATSGSSPTSYSVKIYDSNSHLLWENDVPAAAEPPGIWNGLALTYSLAAVLNHDVNGNIIGVNGSYAGPLNILQNFWESILSNPLNSGTVEVQ